MDGMTMVFKAGDPAMLKDVKAGHKVKFTADRVTIATARSQITRLDPIGITSRLQKAK
jgi:Cu/Ag efflux protein CusF